MWTCSSASSALRAGLIFVLSVLPLAASPLHAETYGGIELGAKGIKATVVDFTPTSDGYDLTVRLAETANTALAAGIAKTGKFDPQALEQTGQAVKRFYDRMRGELRIKPENIFVVGSSGLFSAIVEKPDLIETNRKALADAVLKAAEVKLDFIDDRREAELSIVGILPAKLRGEGILLDVGGGNTKGGFQTADGKIATFAIPFATLTFWQAVRDAGGTFADKAEQLRAEKLCPLLRKEFEQIPGALQRKRVYLSGGIAWVLATLLHPGDTQSFTPLSVQDIDTLLAKLKDGKELTPPDLSSLRDDASRKRALAEFEKVKGTYSPEQLLAGAHVLKALAEELELQKGERTMYFARHGYLGWLLAYVTEKK
jgi:exopolyphosphatase/pppGpp-phosphohydrolase